MGLLQPAEVGEVIRRIRTGKGLTQQQVAEAVQVNQSLVSYWERGVYMPGRDHLEALATALDIPVEDLILDTKAEAANG